MIKIDRECVEEVQSVLRAERVNVFVVGREKLENRRSLTFIADQAMLSDRPGFSFGGDTDRYCVQGGLDEGELDDVFRSAVGRRVELEVGEAVRRWGAGESVSGDSLPPLVAKELAAPISVPGLRKISSAIESGVVRAFGEAAGGRISRVAETPGIGNGRKL